MLPRDSASNRRWIGAWLRLNFESDWIVRNSQRLERVTLFSNWPVLPRINIHGYKVGTTHIQLAEADAVDIYRPKVSTSLKWNIYIAHYSYTPKKLRIPTGVNDTSNVTH